MKGPASFVFGRPPQVWSWPSNPKFFVWQSQQTFKTKQISSVKYEAIYLGFLCAYRQGFMSSKIADRRCALLKVYILQQKLASFVANFLQMDFQNSLLSSCML
jgi:hypothetical protein